MDHQIVIRTRYGCVTIGRAQRLSDGSVVYERALNAYDLAPAALDAIVAQGGVRWVDAEYACPQDLAVQARWPEQVALAG
jgi:hypothetical protein